MEHRKGIYFLRLKWHGWAGLGVIGASEILLFSGVPFVSTYFTPLVWSGYILFADSLVFGKKKASLILTRPKEFGLMLFLSIGFWLIFEFYNLFIRNWYYVGLPEKPYLRWLGYAWAFATIWPGILETAEVLESCDLFSRGKIRPLKITKGGLFFSWAFGAFCLVIPFLTPPYWAQYLAAPVWLGFIFFLDPLNYWLGGNSLSRDLQKGKPGRIYRLLTAGLICGGLWEFWNYWAGAKWHYTVPILGDVKIFEMPILGYLGFPPFALECHVMYVFAWNLWKKLSGQPLAFRGS